MTRNRTINDGEDQEKPIATVALPYVRNTSECIKRILAKLKNRTYFKPYRTLQKLVVHPKDRIKKRIILELYIRFLVQHALKVI